MNAVLIVAALSAANGCLYSSSRMIHSLAIDGMAPRFAARTSAHGSPRRAVAIATLGMLIAAVLALVSEDRAFMYLFGCATIGVLVTWGVTMCAHLAFRKKRAAAGLPLPRRRLAGSPYVDWIVIAATLAIFVGLYWLLPVVWYAGVPYVIGLLASYAVLKRTLTEPTDLLAEEIARTPSSTSANREP